MSQTRRTMLEGTAAGLLLAALPLSLRAQETGSAQETGDAQDLPQLAEPEPYSFEQLIERARALAQSDYQAPVVREPETLERIDYDAYQAIRYREDAALWQGDEGPYEVQLFHPGRYFKKPVAIHLVDNGGARKVLYTPELFAFGPKAQFASELPGDLGFAGFRLQGREGRPDWLAFLGASYFRSSGELDQYGLSARGVAVNTALPIPEEFPDFEAFWLQPQDGNPNGVIIDALLNSPSLTGAFRIIASKNGAVSTDVDARLFARASIERLGIAPLTSMFWFAEHNRHQARDWRPEIHDSDGLAMWTGAGERLWRPLNNPDVIRTSSFFDENPRGFGLVQRDRNFQHYEDDGVFYDRRPTVWIEPKGDWGRGVVQLVELPTDDEIHDNIVVYWNPELPVDAGSEWRFAYRMHWVASEPFPPLVATATDTRLGKGGIPGQPRPEGVRKFVVDFSGGPLEHRVKSDAVRPIVSASRGEISNAYALQVVGTQDWRAFFDLDVEGEEPVELRMFLEHDGQPMTETWLFQYLPFQYPEAEDAAG